MARVHVSLPDYQHRQLKHLADMTGRAVSHLIHQAISDFWDSQTDATQAAVRMAMRETDEAAVIAASEVAGRRPDSGTS
jgi:predicted transcriptional regulator